MTKASSALVLLARDLVSCLDSEVVAELSLICNHSEGLPLSAIPEVVRLNLEKSFPGTLHVDPIRSHISVPNEIIRKTLQTVLAQAGKKELAVLHPVVQIREALASSNKDQAPSLFMQHGGMFFAHIHGLEAAKHVVNAFPEDVRLSNEHLLMADAINAMKSGNFSHANHLIEEHFGSVGKNINELLSSNWQYTKSFACFRFIKSVFDDEIIDDVVLKYLFNLLGSLPTDASLQRGMLYNVALDVFVRRRQWATAEDTASRAKHHFLEINAQFPVFYIDLYRAMIALSLGNVTKAQTCLNDAEGALTRFKNAASNDYYLLRVMRLICGYEIGNPQPLIKFVLSEMEENAFGEIWPAIAEPIIALGSIALATNMTLEAARAYLERWRLQNWRSDRFLCLISLCEITVLQFHRRWQSADDLLTRVCGRITNKFVFESPNALARLELPEEIEVAIKWTRIGLENMPRDDRLFNALSALIDNPGLNMRQRLQVLLWKVMSANAQGDSQLLKPLILDFLEAISKSQLESVLNEQQQLLMQLMTNRQARRFLMSSPKVGGFLHAHKKFLEPASDTLAKVGLTQQEGRVLFLLAEHVPNKLIARRLGLSESTIKFHLKNLYRKLNCSKRKEAVDTAFSSGILTK